MSIGELAFKTATELSDMLTAKEVSAVELTQDMIARIELHDVKTNAICVRDFGRGLDAAKAADADRARGVRKPLLGIPMTVKESFNVAGLPTTWGFSAYRNFIAAEDALAISRVKEAGAVVLAKTNVPVALADWQSYNDIYGTTNNPYDLGRTPGGSSGGSAAALAAGLGSLSLGSDIGGSLRVPAYYCGVYAHKPTFNLAPLRGHSPPPLPPLPFERDLSVIGPMARSAVDCALLLDVIAGPDPIDMGVAYSLNLPPPRHKALRDYRVIVLDTHPMIPSSGIVRHAIETLAAQLENAGVVVTRDAALLPDLTEATRLYMRMLMSFLGASMPSDVHADVRNMLSTADAASNDLGMERMRGIVSSHAEWVTANAARTRLRAQWREIFGSFDAVICPVMPTPAYPHDHIEDQEKRVIDIDGVEYPYSDQLAWPGIATLPGLPSTAIPLSLSADGLPIGVQIIGPWLEDRTPLRIAALIQEAFGGFVRPSGFG